MSLQLITTVDSARVAQNQFVAFNAPTTSVDFFGLIGIKVCDSPSVIRMEKDNPRRASWIVHFPFSDDGLVLSIASDARAVFAITRKRRMYRMPATTSAFSRLARSISRTRAFFR